MRRVSRSVLHLLLVNRTSKQVEATKCSYPDYYNNIIIKETHTSSPHQTIILQCILCGKRAQATMEVKRRFAHYIE